MGKNNDQKRGGVSNNMNFKFNIHPSPLRVVGYPLPLIKEKNTSHKMLSFITGSTQLLITIGLARLEMVRRDCWEGEYAHHSVQPQNKSLVMNTELYTSLIYQCCGSGSVRICIICPN